MEIKTKEQYNEFLKRWRTPNRRETLPLGRKHLTKSGIKKDSLVDGRKGR